MRLGRFRGVALGAVSIGFVLASVAGVLAASQRATNQAHAALQAAQARLELTRLNELEWEMMARQSMTVASLEEYASSRTRFQRWQADMPGHVDPATRARLRQAASEYLAAAHDEFQLLRARDVAGAREVDETRTDPAFERLDPLVGTVTDTLHQRAEAAQAQSQWLAAGIVPLVVLLVLYVWRREQRLRARQLQAERDAAARFEAIARNATDLVAITDPAGVASYHSPSVSRLLGLDPGAEVALSTPGLVHRDDLAPLAATLARVADEADGEATIEFRVRRGDGGWCTLEAHLQNMLADPTVRGIVWNARDVTDRRALERQLTHQAFHDGLTGLANRALLADRLGQALLRLDREPGSVAVLVLDLDGFKDVNDSLGHTAGDQLLVEVARRLRAALRAGDTAARLGGDEFAVILASATTEQALVVARRIGDELARPVPLAGTQVRVTASIGVTVEQAATAPPAGLLLDADIAMYEAKRRGKSQAVLFQEGMQRLVRDRLELTADLQQAIERDQITVAYQPLVDLADGRIRGFEALARWSHPRRGPIVPDVFIPIAEESGLITALDRRMLSAACAQVAAWQRETGRPELAISVNLSGRHLAEPELTGYVRDLLAGTGLPPATLTLEITETAVVDDPTTVAIRLRELHGLGVRIAIDDFGTGYSSLAYLRQLPIDVLKIDRTFVQQTPNQRDQALLSGVMALGHALELELVAEGIEADEQLQRVRMGGCQTGQGFLFSKALEPADAAALLQGKVQHPAAANSVAS